MAKLNTQTQTVRRVGVLKAVKETINHEGYSATRKSNKTVLFLSGLGSFYGEKKFYQSADVRDSEFVKLIHKVTKSDPEWVAGFLVWMRTQGNIRTASLVGAVEYVRAGGANGRSVVNGVLVRGDEPAELLAYYLNNYGRKIPAAIKRGIADGATRLYNESNYAKWNGSNAVQMADVIELTHPKPSAQWQSDLFKYAIDERHGRGVLEGSGLTALSARKQLSVLTIDERHKFMRLVQSGNVDATEKFGIAMAGQWEWAMSWLGG